MRLLTVLVIFGALLAYFGYKNASKDSAHTQQAEQGFLEVISKYRTPSMDNYSVGGFIMKQRSGGMINSVIQAKPGVYDLTLRRGNQETVLCQARVESHRIVSLNLGANAQGNIVCQIG